MRWSKLLKLCMNLKVIAMKLPKESYALQCNGMQVSNKPQVKETVNPIFETLPPFQPPAPSVAAPVK